MSGPATQLRKRWVITATRCVLLTIFFGILVYWLQPLAQRYENQTARDWFAEFLPARRLRADVVLAFRKQPVNMLIGTIDSANRLSRVGARISPELSGKLRSVFSSDRRRQVAIVWLAVLQHQGHDVVPFLAKAGQTNTIGEIFSCFQESDVDKLLAEVKSAEMKYQLERAKSHIRKHGSGHIEILVENLGAIKSSALFDEQNVKG